MEYALSPSLVKEIFETAAVKQCTRELLFSDVVDLMAGVVCQVFPSVSAAYQKQAWRLAVGRRAVYDKSNQVEPNVTRPLVVQTARRLESVVGYLARRAGRERVLPGYRVRILDGKHLAATELRIAELRSVASGPLPGHSLVVLDPDSRLIMDILPCEDGHAQERSLLVDVLDRQRRSWTAWGSACRCGGSPSSWTSRLRTVIRRFTF